ncbi:S-layer homology domain-containing protein [Cohnella cellulosilytica]|uniref:S-layer homology domain-containing protein n=1 Tax=Cohnella cellulosilytica TaxID=986710 RepID=A0ABW2FFL2_9BACL
MKNRTLSLVIIVALLFSSFTFVPVSPVSASPAEQTLLMSDSMFIRQNKGVQTSNFLAIDGRTNASDIRRMSFVKFNLADYQDHPESIGTIALRYYVSLIDRGNANQNLNFYVLPQDLEEKWSNNMTYEEADAAGLVSYTNGDSPDGRQPVGPVGSIQTTADLSVAIKSHLEAHTEDATVIIKIDVRSGEDFVATLGRNTPTDDQKPALVIGMADGYETFVPAINEIKDRIGTAVSEDITLPDKIGDVDISWTSNNPEVMDDTGIIVARPGFNEPDKQASYSATLSADGKALTVTHRFKVLHLGSYAGKITDREDRRMEVEFNTAVNTPEAEGYLLELPNRYLDPQREYILHTPDEVKDGVVRFTPSKNGDYTVVNVSGLAVGGTVRFTIEAPDALISASDEMPILRGIDGELRRLADIADGLIAVDTHAVTEDLNLPASQDDVSIAWSSSNAGVISNAGIVNRPYADQRDAIVELKAVLNGGGKTYSRTYVLTVPKRTGANEFAPLQDPNRMTDESFFGVWNPAGGGSWSVQPILQYDRFGGLNEVLNSVKAGDYPGAKENLLVYYRTRTGVAEYVSPAHSSANDIVAEMTKDKVISFTELDTGVGQATVSTDWDYYTVPLSKLNSAYFLLDSDMDGSSVQVYSKENPGDKPPVLEVVVDGTTRTLTAVADTYISAGDNKNINYGAQPILNVREAASASDMPIGALTARTYFRFATEEIVGDVTSINLKFYARSTSGTKKLYVMLTNNQKEFDENALTWAGHYPEAFNFKETGYIWLDPNQFISKWGVENEWPNFVSRLYQLPWLMSSYVDTNDEIYAYRAFELLLSMYKARSSSVYSRILETGWRTKNIDDLFFGGLNSGSMTPEVLTAMLKYMYDNALSLKDATPDAGANWQSAIRVGFMRMCAYTPEIVPESWWEHGKARLQDLYSSGIFNADGSYLESTTGYMIGVIDELKLAMELITTRDDEDDPTYQFLLEQYRRLAKYYFDLTMNEGHHVPWGDGPWNDVKKFAQNENEYDPNPYFEYFATDGQSGIEPNYTSIVYPGKAVAIMRDNWLPDGLSAFIQADGGGNHSHADDLALDVYGYGRRLLVEIGNSSYSPGSLMAANRLKTISHNTIEIDNTDQYRNAYDNVSQKLNLATNRLFDFVDGNSSQIYNKAFNTSIGTNFDVNRKVLFLHNSYWIVSDYITPADSNPHTYRQAWHPDANNGLTIDPATKAMVTHYEQGGADIAVVPADPETLDALKVQNYMNSPEAGITLSDYLQYVREDVAGPQTFDTVLYPFKTGENADVAVARIPLDTESITATALQIDIGQNTGYYYSSNEALPSRRDFGDYATDGQMAYVEKDSSGHATTAALTKGTMLSDGDIVLVSSGETLGDFGVQWNADNTLALYTSGALPADGVEIYAAQPVNGVVLNGQAIAFTYSNNVVSTNGEPTDSAPVVTAVSPAGGPEAGGTEVTITGSGLSVTTAVYFGGNPAASFTAVSDTSVIAVAPAGSGTVDITVMTPYGTSAPSAADRFTYVDTQTVPVLQSATAGDERVTLAWSSVPGATGYNIYKSTASGSYDAAHATVSGSVYGYDATGLTNGTTYFFVVSASVGGNDSGYSNEVSATPRTVPGAPTGVTATAGNGQAVVRFTPPADNGGSAITEYTVTSSPEGIAATGTGTAFTVTGLTNGTAYTFTVTATNAAGTGPASADSNRVTPSRPAGGSSGGGYTGGNDTPSAPPASADADLIVDGKTGTAATTTTVEEGGRTVTTVALDDAKLEEMLRGAGDNPVVTLLVNNETDAAVGLLSGRAVKNMAEKGAVLELKTGRAAYSIPASQINIDAIVTQFGAQTELKDITVSVKISEPDADTVKLIEAAANKNNDQLAVPPIVFEIICASGGKAVEISKFNAYVERTIAIPEGVDPAKITTGVVLNADGTLSHVPTAITLIDGRYYARINSLTNSAYALIHSQRSFKDIASHWAKETVEDMASRLVINGVSEDKFEPDRDITRAEFAAIAVKALGLMRPGMGKDLFSDVPKGAWYYDAVTIAHEYGLISGYADGKFGPNDKISREQAMVIISRAMEWTGLKAELPTDDQAGRLLEAYSDAGLSADYARTGIAACIDAGIVSGRNGNLLAPKDNLTRAEAAAIARRLLEVSNLI